MTELSSGMEMMVRSGKATLTQITHNDSAINALHKKITLRHELHSQSHDTKIMLDTDLSAEYWLTLPTNEGEDQTLEHLQTILRKRKNRLPVMGKDVHEAQLSPNI